MASSGVPASGQQQVELAAKAYVYGYPLVYDLQECRSFVEGSGAFPVKAPYNSFGHVLDLAGPDLTFVTPNADTCYSLAIGDLGSGPLVLRTPDTGGRYFVGQFVDAWTNNFAYVGKRATGTAEREFLIVPPEWKGRAPAGMATIEAPTRIFTLIVRVQVDGPDDVPAVNALQRAFTLTPLAVHQGGPAPAPVAGIPEPDPRVPEPLRWWESLRVALAAFPPGDADADADADALALCRGLGLLEPESPFVDLPAERAAVLVEGAAAGQAMIEKLMMDIHATPEGWQVTTHLFDYNTDHLGLGTIDTPEWRIADRERAIATRAVVARAGLWGNHGYEADYAIVWVDSDGQKLDGAHTYELTLPGDPPVEAFWSLTMYDVPDFYLVANPIGRYTIGDRTPGLVRGDDGSLTIYLQHEEPEGERKANWLPAPAGPFRPTLRMYLPRDEVLDGRYTLPAIVRTG